MKRTFRVYFLDGNQKLYESNNIVECINFIACVDSHLAGQIVKVEEVEA